MLVDTHAHLTDPRFAGDVAEVIARATSARVGWIVTIASDIPDSERAISLAAAHPNVYATAGIHPHAAESADAAAFARLTELLSAPGVVAVGETGLDFHYDNAPRARQIESFERHLELGRQADLPVIVHARSADEEVGRLLREAPGTRGMLHCFSGGRALLETALELGWSVSFGGMITFPKWEGADLFRAIPEDRLLLETDSPYLAPVPHRGRRNEPSFLPRVAERAALLRGVGLDHLSHVTSLNAARFFGIEAAPDRAG